MISPEEALELVISTARPLASQLLALSDACGLVLAEDILADDDYPPFARAKMDGFAVRVADAGMRLPVLGEIAAGSVWQGSVHRGQSVKILTGAPCPCGADAVVQKELVKRQGDFVVLPASIEPGQNIAPRGSDCQRGERVLAQGQVVTGMGVGALAAFGVEAVKVIPRPRIAIITTGDEFDQREGPLRSGRVRNSNGPMLAAMARSLGISTNQAHASDRLEATVQALNGVSDIDIVVFVGGVSVGDYDFVPRALMQVGADVVFHGVRQKPGKPILFARKRSQLIFGLPGNPLSCHFGFHRYVTAAIQKMCGHALMSQHFCGELTESIVTNGGRVQFIPAWVKAKEAASSIAWQVEILSGASSADIFRSCRANCYVQLPAGEHHFQAGDTVAFTWLVLEAWP